MHAACCCNDSDTSSRVYDVIVSSQPLTQHDVLTIGLLNLTNKSTRVGMCRALRKQSETLKSRLLDVLKNSMTPGPEDDYGGLWCWAVRVGGPRAGSAMRLIDVYRRPGRDHGVDTLFTFRTLDGFKHHPDPTHGTHILRRNEFELVWVNRGPSPITGEILRGWELEIDTSLY